MLCQACPHWQRLLVRRVGHCVPWGDGGDGCVIGAGSVVTRDIPPNSFAAGVPCRVIREITEADSMARLPQVLADIQIIPEE